MLYVVDLFDLEGDLRKLLREWHQHPFGHLDNHVGCKEPAMDKIFEEVAGILRGI